MSNLVDKLEKTITASKEEKSIESKDNKDYDSLKEDYAKLLNDYNTLYNQYNELEKQNSKNNDLYEENLKLKEEIGEMTKDNEILFTTLDDTFISFSQIRDIANKVYNNFFKEDDEEEGEDN
jgi:uncharacterized protein YlxW (UPF0749 family)